MSAGTFYFEEKRLREEISKRKAKRVLIQLPEGLKPEGPRLAAVVEEAGALAFISADPCYGACDLALPDAETLGVDLLVHFGHSPMIQQEKVPTIYIEAKARVNADTAIRKALPLLKGWKAIGVATTIQHTHMLNGARDLLREAGKKVVVGEAGGLAKYAGQVIGCDYTTVKSIVDEVEAFLFIGGGKFHALGVSLATAKPTVVADPYEKRAYSIENEVRRIIKQRWASIHEAKHAENFGVLIGLKTGQKRVEEALQIKEKLEKTSKTATLLAIKQITPEALMQFPCINAFVNTACLRMALDEASKFLRPVLNINETLVMLGEESWEALCQKGWF
jgi:2-(3-amino-3-carboxypropyl)histidine synthase